MSPVLDEEPRDVQLVAVSLPAQPVRQVMVRLSLAWDEQQSLPHLASRFVIQEQKLQLYGAAVVSETLQDPAAISSSYLTMRSPLRTWPSEMSTEVYGYLAS